MVHHSNPIKFCSFGGYRRFCKAWWKDLFWWLTRGWAYDIQNYWLRARYGWAPRDTWSLDDYISGVLGGALEHLAANTHGTPPCYPRISHADCTPDCEPDHAQWEADLRRWAAAFRAYSTHDYYEKHGKDYKSWHEDEIARYKAVQQALREIEPWFGALWD